MNLRSLAMACTALASVVAFVHFLGGIYPVDDWLFWTVAKLWAWQGLLVASFLAFGNLILERLLRVPPTTRIERLTLAAAVGALVFGLGMFAAGIFAWLSPTWAVVWPTTMLVAGVAGARASFAALLTPSKQLAQPDSLFDRLKLAFGILCLGIVYLGVFSPDAVNYDASWVHLTAAQDFAREGRIVPFYADWPRNLAHLASLIDTWAFLLPGLGPPPVRWMMALHIEFAFFTLTLLGVAAGVSWALRRSVKGAWVALFLLPGLFVYDSNLGGSADHIAAFFAAPALVASGRASRTMDRRWWGLFGLLAGGAILTKYQSVYFLAPLATLLAVAWVGAAIHLVRNGRRAGPGRQAALPIRERQGQLENRWRLWTAGTERWWPLLSCPIATTAAMVIVTGPHFVRNWVLYRNPFYPLALRLFPGSRPQMPDSAIMAENIMSSYGLKPPAEWGRRLAEAVRLLFDFSFHTHAGFTRNVPVFGSLFTLCLPLVIFLPRAGRIRLTVGLAVGAVFLWAWTYWVDRNLQTFAPLLAIATGAVLARAWDTGYLARVAVVVLVGVQLVWSGDHFFLGSDRIASSMALIRSGFDGRARSRFDQYGAERVAIGRALPRNAKVLLHSTHVNLGIDRPVLLDWLGMQGLIDSRTFRSPRDLYDRAHALGVTHIVFHPGFLTAPTKQDEVIFAAFADRCRSVTMTFGDLRLIPMPEIAPPTEAPYTVLVIGVGDYPDGVYDVAALSINETMPGNLQKHGGPRFPIAIAAAAQALASVDAVLLGDAGRPLRTDPNLINRFRLATEYPGLSVWVLPR